MNFENIVFAGGGNRCFWQAGFWKTIYAHPTRPVSFQSWDYTNPQGVRSSYDQGIKEGFTFLKQPFIQ